MVEGQEGTEDASKVPEAKRPPRPHPYKDEASTEAEAKHDPRKVTLVWFVASTAIAAAGLLLNHLLSPYTNRAHEVLDADWFSTYDNTSVILLMVGLLLLGLRAWLPHKSWTKRLAIPGWLLAAFFWALTARDLFVTEDADYVNSIAAVLAAYMFSYFAYHEWLNLVRRVPNEALQFLRKSAVIVMGSYYAISYIVFLRIGLIKMVGHQTNAALAIFGADQRPHFELREAYTDRLGPVSFWYEDTLGTCPDGTAPVTGTGTAPCLGAYDGAGNWFQDLLFYIPKAEEMAGEHGLKIVMVSIILACTAIQSIMLFVGMFVATPDAHWKKKLQFSVGVGLIIYVLNLFRNAGVIWAYGRGHMSFWFVHNFLAKVVTLSVLVGIAYICFRGFPEFFRALGTVLDLPQRDGPIERTLRLGKRRPETPGSAEAPPDGHLPTPPSE